MRAISLAYMGVLASEKEKQKMHASDDAVDCCFFDIVELPGRNLGFFSTARHLMLTGSDLAFDHSSILQQGWANFKERFGWYPFKTQLSS